MYVNKFIEFSTGKFHYILPWHAPTVIHVINSKNINMNQLLFRSEQHRQQFTHELFLLATSDSLTSNHLQASPLAVMARQLMS